MRIQNNITAMNTHRQYTINNENVAKNAEKLSSGYRINRAGDDAAGLAISEKMRSQIRGLNMATKNSQDAISLVQTAEGALQETQNMLQRMNELAVQAATGTNESLDRTALAKEFEQLKREINDIAEQTTFNNMKILDGSMSYKGYARSADTAGVTVTEQANIAGAASSAVTGGSNEILLNTDLDELKNTVPGKGQPVTVMFRLGNTQVQTYSAERSGLVLRFETEPGDGKKSAAELLAGGLTLVDGGNASDWGAVYNRNTGEVRLVSLDGSDIEGMEISMSMSSVDEDGNEIDFPLTNTANLEPQPARALGFSNAETTPFKAADEGGPDQPESTTIQVRLEDVWPGDTITIGDRTYVFTGDNAVTGDHYSAGENETAIDWSSDDKRTLANMVAAMVESPPSDLLIASDGESAIKITQGNPAPEGAAGYVSTKPEPGAKFPDGYTPYAGEAVSLHAGTSESKSASSTKATITGMLDTSELAKKPAAGRNASLTLTIPSASADGENTTIEFLGTQEEGGTKTIQQLLNGASSVTTDGWTLKVDADGKFTVTQTTASKTNFGALPTDHVQLSADGFNIRNAGAVTEPVVTNGTNAPTTGVSASVTSDGKATQVAFGSGLKAGDEFSVGGKYFRVTGDEPQTQSIATHSVTAGTGTKDDPYLVKLDSAAADVKEQLKRDGFTVEDGPDGSLLVSRRGKPVSVAVDDGSGNFKRIGENAESSATKDVTVEVDFAKLKEGDKVRVTVDGYSFDISGPASGQSRSEFLDGLRADKNILLAGGEVKGNSVVFKGLDMKTSVETELITDATVKADGSQADGYRTNALRIQVGALENEQLNISIDAMTTKGLGIDDAHLTVTGGTTEEQQDEAGRAITMVRDAINKVSDQRATLGAMQNRLDHKIANLKVASENLSASESRIRDVDMASEMTQFTKNNILSQAATAMLAQANSLPQNVLSLLG